MAGLANALGSGLASTFQSRLYEKLKDRGLIPMSSGVTRPLAPAGDYSLTIEAAKDEIARAREVHGARTDDRYSATVGTGYRDRRFEFIKSLEGVSLKAYPDAGGTSVGLGFHMDKNGARDTWNKVFGKSVSFDAVKSGKTHLTMGQAKALFEHDSVYYEGLVDKATKGKALPQNQRLALFSIAYNAPKRFLDNADVWRNGSEAEITGAILTKTFDPKKGDLLKSRRHAEAQMFVSTTEADELIPSWSEYSKAVKVGPDGKAIINGDPNEGLAIINRMLPAKITRQAVAIPQPGTRTFVDQVQGSQAKTRRADISPKLYNLLNGVGSELNVHFEVYSGGQNEKTGFTGSTRHDHGEAADVRAYVVENGKRRYLDQSNPADRKVWSQIVKLSRAGGATGIGAAEGYMGNGAMHIGFNGKPRVVNGKVVKSAATYTGVWGAGGSSQNAPKWLRDAWDAGAHVPPLNIPDVASQLDTSRVASGPDVATVQTMLNDRGFNPGPIDGIKGEKTTAAVKAFQKAHGLKVDGIVGPKTLAALESAQAVTPAAVTAAKVRAMLDEKKTPSASETAAKLSRYFDTTSNKPVTVYVRPDGTQRRVAGVAGDTVLPPDMTYDWETGRLVKKSATSTPTFVTSGAAKMAGGGSNYSPYSTSKTPVSSVVMPRAKPLGLMSQTTGQPTTKKIAAPVPMDRTPARTVAQRAVVEKPQGTTASGTPLTSIAASQRWAAQFM